MVYLKWEWSWLSFGFFIFILLGSIVLFEKGGAFILNTHNPKKDIYGQNCILRNLTDDWECPSDSAEFKRLKAENCRHAGYTGRGEYIEKMYHYDCANGKRYVLETNYYGIK